MIASHSSPTPAVTWARIGAPLPANRTSTESHGQILVIEDIQDEDAGTYECVGSNDSPGTATQTFFLNIEGTYMYFTI